MEGEDIRRERVSEQHKIIWGREDTYYRPKCGDGKMKNIYREIREALIDGDTFALATVVGTEGSTPRSHGAKMIIREDGSAAGTIGGGCGEAEVWQEAKSAIRDGTAKLVTVDLTEDVEGGDKICGGKMLVLIEPFNRGEKS